MTRLLRELDRLDAAGGTIAGKTSRGSFFSVAAAVGFVSLGGLVMLHEATGLDISLTGISRPSPLGTPEPAPPGHGGYAFAQVQPGDPDLPAAYSPCKAIHVVINDELAPAGAGRTVETALAEVGEITGLKFIVDGSASEQPQDDSTREKDQPALIAWTTPDQIPGLTGRVAGLGGSTVTIDPRTHRAYLISGQVALDAPQLTQVLQRPSGPAEVHAIVLHELGHLVGLDHVNDPSQLMYRENVGVLDFQDGDRRGLALLGSGACVS